MEGKFDPKVTSYRYFYMPQICDVWDRTAFTSAPKEGALRIFFFALKNPKASAGFEPANLGTKGQHHRSCYI
jgi:hypothetical protein